MNGFSTAFSNKNRTMDRQQVCCSTYGNQPGHPDGTVSEDLIAYWEPGQRRLGTLILRGRSRKAIPTSSVYGMINLHPAIKISRHCTPYGAKIAVQIHYAGRQTSSDILVEGPVAPSAVLCFVTGNTSQRTTGRGLSIDRSSAMPQPGPGSGFDGGGDSQPMVVWWPVLCPSTPTKG